MALYGGTLLNYCVAFSLRKVVESIYRGCLDNELLTS